MNKFPEFKEEADFGLSAGLGFMAFALWAAFKSRMDELKDEREAGSLRATFKHLRNVVNRAKEIPAKEKEKFNESISTWSKENMSWKTPSGQQLASLLKKLIKKYPQVFLRSNLESLLTPRIAKILRKKVAKAKAKAAAQKESKTAVASTGSFEESASFKKFLDKIVVTKSMRQRLVAIGRRGADIEAAIANKKVSEADNESGKQKKIIESLEKEQAELSDKIRAETLKISKSNNKSKHEEELARLKNQQSIVNVGLATAKLRKVAAAAKSVSAQTSVFKNYIKKYTKNMNKKQYAIVVRAYEDRKTEIFNMKKSKSKVAASIYETKPYYIIFAKNEDGDWEQGFGDYNKNVVIQERKDEYTRDRGYKDWFIADFDAPKRGGPESKVVREFQRALQEGKFKITKDMLVGKARVLNVGSVYLKSKSTFKEESFGTATAVSIAMLAGLLVGFWKDKKNRRGVEYLKRHIANSRRIGKTESRQMLALIDSESEKYEKKGIVTSPNLGKSIAKKLLKIYPGLLNDLDPERLSGKKRKRETASSDEYISPWNDNSEITLKKKS